MALNGLMMQHIANRVMASQGHKACRVIDHLVEALGSMPSSPLRRALILVDIDQNPHTTQSNIMERLNLPKPVITREIDWLYNYGCIMRQDCMDDARSKTLTLCGYSKISLNEALAYCEGHHENLKLLLSGFIEALNLEKATLRDAKLVATLYEQKEAVKKDILGNLYDMPGATDHRAYNKLVQEGIIQDG